MENRRPKPVPGPARAGTGGEKADSGRDQTPLPIQEENWASLGATRVIVPDPVPAHTEARSAEDTAFPPASLPDNVGQKSIQLGDYRLLKKIGEGAMGAVYKAHQISFNREVALKILFKHVAANPKLVERLHREGLAMGRLDHPNIVTGYGVGEDQGWHFFAMEYVEGESLQKWLTRLGRLSLGDAVHITLACARALQYAHDLGLVHRDIKPDNVLINRQGTVKVADLGMVKQLDENMSLTQTGHAVGTPWYMPLEQARDAKETDRRCDIYALGCMFYCLLTGQPPFSGRTLVEVIEAKDIGTFAPARQFSADVPERVDLIIAKMAAKLPRYRYQNCADLIKDLESLELANDTLSFLSKAGQRTAPATSPKAAQPTMAGPGALLAADEQTAPDTWYVRLHTADGQIAVRKLTTAQVLKLVESKNFDPTAEASKKPKEGFRALATYREFQGALLGRVSKTAADEQTARYRALYKKIEEQERKRERVVERPATTFTYWLGIFLKVAGLCAAVGFGIFLLWYFGTGLGR